MEYLLPHVSIQYVDFKGLVSVDFHGGDVDIYTLCEDLVIDLANRFPVAFRFAEHIILGVGLGVNVYNC